MSAAALEQQAAGREEEAYAFSDVVSGVEEVLQGCATEVLAGQRYSPAKVGEWTNGVLDLALERLRGVSENFKFVVHATLVEKEKGCGFHADSVALWDSRTDGAVTVKWENDSIMCVLVTFALAL